MTAAASKPCVDLSVNEPHNSVHGNKHCSTSTPTAPTTRVKKSSHDRDSLSRHDSRLSGMSCSNPLDESLGLLFLPLSGAL